MMDDDDDDSWLIPADAFAAQPLVLAAPSASALVPSQPSIAPFLPVPLPKPSARTPAEKALCVTRMRELKAERFKRGCVNLKTRCGVHVYVPGTKKKQNKK